MPSFQHKRHNGNIFYAGLIKFYSLDENVTESGGLIMINEGHENFLGIMKLLLTAAATLVFLFSNTVQSSETRFIVPSPKAPVDSSANSESDFDTPNIKSEADFNIEVADDVYWVPANSLGGTRYSNVQMAAIVERHPEQKQESIKTLYEAIQLFQISKFKGIYDNIRIKENGIDWEHHKPGYDAVRTNEGCCASNSSWLSYILKNDYDEIGICGFGQHDGNGHVINYIRDDGWYYFIDMMQYRIDSLPTSGIETGKIKDYLKAYEPGGGNIHRSRSIFNYIEYLKTSLKHTPCFFITCNRDNYPPIGLCFADEKTSFIYPENQGIKIHYQDTDKTKVEVIFTAQPGKFPDWSIFPDFKFSPVDLPF